LNIFEQDELKIFYNIYYLLETNWGNINTQFFINLLSIDTEYLLNYVVKQLEKYIIGKTHQSDLYYWIRIEQNDSILYTFKKIVEKSKNTLIKYLKNIKELKEIVYINFIDSFDKKNDYIIHNFIKLCKEESILNDILTELKLQKDIIYEIFKTQKQYSTFIESFQNFENIKKEAKYLINTEWKSYLMPSGSVLFDVKIS
jgi:hypothetical protein